VLTQVEINSLLDVLESGEFAERSKEFAPGGEALSRVDLTNQERIRRGGLPGLELIFDAFSRRARGTLTKELSRNIGVSFCEIKSCKWARVIKQLPIPSSMHLVRLPPLPGHALLIVSSPLVYGLVETLFGGGRRSRTQAKVEGRDFSAIENRIVLKVLMSLLDDLREAWKSVYPVEIVYTRTEFNPLALSFVSQTDTVAVGRVGVELDACSGSIDLCFPCSLLDPLKSQLSSGIQSQVASDESGAREKIRKNLSKAKVDLQVILGEGRIKARELLK
jgi:flagellar motor switch protein FliM